MTIKELVSSLLDNPDCKVFIRGKKKEIAGFAEFRTVNLGDQGYFKITFDDHSFLFIVPSDDLVLYTDEPPQFLKEISDKDIGKKKEVTFRGRRYELDNADDYQFVVRLIKGNYETIEGEVKFSDYIPKDGANELLSLGWIVRTGERADVNPKELSLDEVSINT